MTKLELAQQKLEHATAVLMCRQYRQIAESLRAFSAKNYSVGTVVQVYADRYRGQHNSFGLNPRPLGRLGPDVRRPVDPVGRMV